MVDNKPVRLEGVKLKNKKHTLARKKAGMRLNNWYNRTDLCNLATTRKSRTSILSPSL